MWLLFRAGDGSLAFSALVLAPERETPVHDHLAWGLVGLYRGNQDEIVYARRDDAARDDFADLVVSERNNLTPGDFYTLLPENDIHRVRTTSDVTSVSLHLLGNDNGCIARRQYVPDEKLARPFRSGYLNLRCTADEARPYLHGMKYMAPWHEWRFRDRLQRIVRVRSEGGMSTRASHGVVSLDNVTRGSAANRARSLMEGRLWISCLTSIALPLLTNRRGAKHCSRSFVRWVAPSPSRASMSSKRYSMHVSGTQKVPRINNNLSFSCWHKIISSLDKLRREIVKNPSKRVTLRLCRVILHTSDRDVFHNVSRRWRDGGGEAENPR